MIWSHCNTDWLGTYSYDISGVIPSRNRNSQQLCHAGFRILLETVTWADSSRVHYINVEFHRHLCSVVYSRSRSTFQFQVGTILPSFCVALVATVTKIEMMFKHPIEEYITKYLCYTTRQYLVIFS